VAVSHGLEGSTESEQRGKEGFEALFGKRLVFFKDTVRGSDFGGVTSPNEPDVTFINVQDPHP
jgi:hypothetical protein